LDGIVSEVQSAFVAGRQMLDGPFIINEIIQWCRSKKRKALIFKVDFEKAFDSVRWDYLDDVLFKFGFGSKCHRKASWIKWSSVVTLKEKGGLGVASLYALNRGLMLKWLWRFYTYPNSIWARVVKAIHGEDGCVGKELKARARFCWLNIVNEALILKEHGVNFFEFLKPKLGDGAKFSFWDDKWCEVGILKSRFPRIYALDTCKKVSVRCKLINSNLESSFRRVVRGEGGVEQSQYDALTELISGINLLPQTDRYVWALDGTGEFSVSSIRHLIDVTRSSTVSSRTRWVKYMPIKLNVFTWKVKLNALPTRFNISRRGMYISSLSCPLCQEGVESSSHLFFNCILIRQLYSKIARWWDISFDGCSSYEEWLEWLNSLRLSVKIKLMLEGVIYSLWWNIWVFCNKTLFDSNPPFKAKLFDDIVSSCFYWCSFRCKAAFSWDVWLKNPSLIVL
nr:RNA-directed DNA polymerase, eukaryota, reverse transcriptase zinc-binding domain protein [Tanacetum cinerariifolium]